MKKHKDLLGIRFSRLLVVECLGSRPYGKGMKIKWRCLCDCGNHVDVASSDLISNHTRSCSCLQKDVVRKSMTTHGLGITPEGRTLARMKQRCYNPKDQDFHLYGGRGIRVCEGWRNSVQNFRQDMGSKPTGKGIDRIRNNLHYSCGKCAECLQNRWPFNCRWATVAEQNNNRRSNKPIEYNGRTLNIAQWARLYGLTKEALASRVKNNWEFERAITTPIRNQKKRIISS